MKILIVTATPMEIKLLTDEMNSTGEKSDFLKSYEFDTIDIDVLIAGIGTVFTTFRLTETLMNNNYDFVLNVGIAGSLSCDLKIGDVVNVVSEEFADMGIENNDVFSTLFEAGFINSNDFPFENGKLNAALDESVRLPKVNGITSNISHGRESTISEIKRKFSAQTESMEGAAVFYVCKQLGFACGEIRAISNFVEPRNSSEWNIPLALESLKGALIAVLKKMAVAN